MMFIRRKEFDALVARVERLESAKHSDEPFTFTVYEQIHLWSICSWHIPPHVKISVKEAIERIMSHLGLSMEYVKGKPEKVAFVKVKK